MLLVVRRLVVPPPADLLVLKALLQRLVLRTLVPGELTALVDGGNRGILGVVVVGVVLDAVQVENEVVVV